MITPLQAFSNLLPLFVAGEAANNLVNETFSISAWSEMFGNNYTVQEGTISCQQFFSLREGFKSAYLDRDQLILITNVTKGEGDGQRKSYSNDQEVYFKTCQIGGQKVTILPCNPQSGSETLKMVFMHGIEQEEKVLQSYYSIEKGNETQWGKILRMGWSELVKAVNDLKKEKFPLEASAESSHAAQSGLESATAAKLVEAEAKVEELRANGAQIEKEKKSLKESIASLQEGLLTESGAKKVLQRQVQKKDTALNDLQSQYDQAFSTIAKLNEELSDLEAKASGLEKNMTTLKSLCNHTQLIVTEEGSNLTEEIDIFQSTLEEKEMTKIAESGALVKASATELDGKNAIVNSLDSQKANLDDKAGSSLQASMDQLATRRGGPGKETMEQMKAVEEKAASAEAANRTAEPDLKQMKEMPLKGGVLNVDAAAKASSGSGSFVYNGDDETFRSTVDDYSLKSSKKGGPERCHSDGIINKYDNGDPQMTSPLRGGNISQKQAQTEMKAKKMKPSAHILTKDKTENVDVMLLREALASKSSQAAELKTKLKQVQQEVEATRDKLEYETGEQGVAKHDLESQVTTLASDKDFALQEQDIIIAEKDSVIASSMMDKIETLTHEQKEQAQVLSGLEAQVESLQGQLATKVTEYTDQVRELNDAQSAKKEESSSKIAEMEGTLEMANSENSRLVKQVEELSRSLSEAKSEKDSLQTEFDETMETVNSNFEKSAREQEQKMTELSAGVSNLTEERDSLQSTLEERETKIAELGALVQASNAELDDKKATVESLQSNKTDLEDKVGSLQASMDELTTVLGEKESSLGEAEATIAALRQESLSSKAVNDLKKEKEALEASVEYLSGLESATAAKLEEKDTALNDLQSQYDKAVSTIAKLNEEKSVLEAKASSLEKNITTLKSLRNDNTQLITTEEGSSSSLEGSFELHDLYTCVRNCSYHLFPFTDMEIWAMITWALGVTSFLCVLIVNFGLGFGLM